jgi:uncharacterized membrane protein
MRAILFAAAFAIDDLHRRRLRCRMPIAKLVVRPPREDWGDSMSTNPAGSNPHSTASIAGHPIHPMLIPFPVAFFVGALATDLAYLRNHDAFWANASQWLLGAGLVMAVLAALAGLTDFLGDRRIRDLTEAWKHMIGNVVLVLIQLFNLYRRIGADPSVIAPTGVVLSLIATLLLLFNGWMGWQMVYRHRVGIAEASSEHR